MKKRLNSSILAATSLTALAVQHQAEAGALVLTEGQLSSLSLQNQLQASDVTTLDFSKLTPEIVRTLSGVPIDLSKFQNVRNIILPWFAAKLNVTLPENFIVPLNDSYSRLAIVQAGVTPSSDSELTLNLEHLLKDSGKVILDTKSIPVSELIAGVSVAKIERNVATVNITVADTIEAIDTNGVIADDVKTSIKLTPSAVTSDQYKAPYIGLPTAVIGSNPSSLDISAYAVAGKDVTVSGMKNLTNLVISQGDSIGALKVTGETTVTTNATSINKLEVTSNTPNQTAIDTMAVVATTVAPSAKDAHIASFVGKTELDFSKLDLGSVDATATRIKDIFEGAVAITSIVSMKISSAVLAAVMTKLSITNLSSFSALKRLDIVSSSGTYQTTTLASADLPSSLEEFYSSNLVVRKGSLSADLEFDSKFSAATLDLSALDINGNALTISGSFTASSVSTLKLNPSLLAVAATKNLISASSSKSIIVSGAAGGALTTTNLQNVGTIDLRSVTGSTSFSAPLNVDGNNGNLSNLYLPSAFDVEAATDILSGVDNGEVTVYLSGAYSGAKTLDASYDKTILNFSGVTGTGRFQLPAGVRGLVLSDAVKGINVGAAAVLNEFDFSGLTYIRQITDLPTSATVLKLNNASASAALQLNLTALTSLTTLQLGSGRISQLSLPASASLTDGGEVEHLDLSTITDLAELNGLNPLLAEGSITQVSFPNNPASTLHINLVDTIEGIQFNNLYQIPELTIDSDYAPGANMWPTVKSKSSSADWSNFLNYIMAPVIQGGINSPSIFDLSGQAIESQAQADALVIALNDMYQRSKSVIQKIVIRLDAASSGAIDLSGIVTTDFSHGSLKIIIDQSTGSTATVSVPGGWTAITKTYISLGQVAKTTAASWTNYLNYRFASLNDKGEAATSLDLSSIDLTAAQWSALMTSLNSFSTPEAHETISLKLVAANDYSSAPAFTTAILSAATSIIVDVTGVKNSGTQVAVTGLPSATVSLQVEQRVTAASSVDRTVSASWKGYLEYLLSNISGTNYTLDLTASDVQIQTTAQLTALNSALAGLSAANKIKIENIKLKIATGNRAADFTVSTDFTGFTNLASLVVDATGALNGTAQSAITFSLTNAPAYAKAHVTSLASVDTDVATSWDYYFAYRLATNGVLLTNLDVSSISLAAQADLTAFLTALENQSGTDKSSVQSIKLKLDSGYVDSTVDLGDGEISGLDHGSFAVEVDRNGANSTAPVSFTFGAAITASNTTIKDTAFTGLGSFDGADAHHWLGYVRTLLGTVASGTTTLDLSIHSALEMNNAKVAKFIAGMNALPDADKVKVATLKIKLASGNFGASTADLSGLSGFSALTSLVVERNGARSSATLYDPAVSVTGPGTVTINDPELRSVSSTAQTNQWLGYLRFVLNGMSGVANTVDLSAFAIDTANAATAINNALEALPASEKLKVQTLKLSASAAVTLGTSVSGFTNLTKVIVDQTTAPSAAITIAGGFGTTQKFYVTLASTAKTSGAWDKYIDYVISSLADGGLNQTTFDLTGLTLTNAQVGQFFAGFNVDQAAAATSLSLKLETAFGANTLTLADPAGFTSLIGADAFKIYRNSAANAGTLVSVDYNGWDDSVVQIIDPTATAVADQTSAQDWLRYLSYVTSQSMFDATSGVGAQNGILDLSSLPLASSGEAVALITALELLDSSLKAKLKAIDVKLASGNFGVGTLDLEGDLSNAAGFTNLTKFMVDATGTETNDVGTQKVVDFSGLTVDAGSKDMWVTSHASVDYASANATNSWLAYIHYQIRNNDTNFTLDTSAINGGAGIRVTEAGHLFDALETLSASGTNKARLTSVTVKLANVGGAATLTIDQDLSNLDGLTSIVVNATDAMHAGAQVALDFGGGTFHANTTTKKAIVSTISSVDKDNQNSWTYFFNTAAMTSVDVSSTTLTSPEAGAFLAALGTGVTAKADITSLTMKLDPTFGAASLSLDGTGLTGLQGSDRVSIQRNGALDAGVPVLVSLSGGFDKTHVRIVDATAGTVADQTSAQDWLKYLNSLLNDATTGYVLDDLQSLNISAAPQIAAFNAALNALDGTLKDKVAELWLTVSAAGELGTNVSGFTTLTKVIVDQTSAPSAAITIAAGTVASGEFDDAATQKFYVTSASTAQTNSAWDKYIDYAMSSVADGGLNQTTFDLTGLTLTNAQVGQFLTALDTYASAAAVTSISLKLASNFGSASLDLSGYANLAGLGADSVVIYRNAAVNAGVPVTVTYGGSFTDSVVQLIDPTTSAVVDTAEAQQWLGYLTGVLNDAASGVTLDLSSIAIDDAQAVTAFNAAITCLDSALSSKVNILKLNVTHAANISLGTGVSGFDNLTRIDFTKPATNTVTFADALAGKRTYLTSFNSVKMDTTADWTRYLNYMLSTTNGGQSASSLNLNTRPFANQGEVDAFFAGLNVLNAVSFYGDKGALTTLRMKLADGLIAIAIGGSTTATTDLNAGLHVIVDPGTSTGTTYAGSNSGEVQDDNLIVLSSTPAFSKEHFAFVAEQGSFSGTVDLTGLDLANADGATLIQELNLLSDDIKANIRTINLKLLSGNFGSSTLTLGALTGFTGVTFNIDRNGAVDGNNTYGPLVTITNNTTHTVNLTDAEFHNMSTFDNESSAHWIGYLTHELNSAAANYTLDLTVNAALMLDSANAVSAFSSALRYLPDSLKTKVALLKIKSSTNGDFGATDWNGPGATERVIPEYAAFDNLASIAIEYTATGLNMGAYVGSLDTTTKYSYVSTPFNGMDWNDWTKYFNYQLNAANVGGLGGTDIVLAQRLSSADLSAILAGLDAASQKALLENLTLNLASDVVGDINVGVAGLTALSTVTINTNGSPARLTPSDDFYDKTTITSVLNVNPAVQGSWRAYLKGQSSIAAIDIREVELADQAELTAFLTALDAESRKATVDTIKIKMASSYAGTASFATVNPAGLTTLDNAGVEIHRNGSTATAVQGGSITNAKIKIVDLTADSLTDRSSAESWRRYLTALIEDGAFAGSIDLALDSDTYLRTNAHVTAFMTALQNLSPANKLLVTSLKLELASGATWSDITDLGQGLSGLDNLTSFVVDATGAYTSAGGNPQVTLAFHADLSAASPKAIVSTLSSVDKDSSASWTYFFNNGAMPSVDVSSITLTSAEATAFLAALGSGVTAKADITSLTMKLDSSFGAASLAFDANNNFTNLATVTVQRNGATNAGSPVSISLSNSTASVSIVDPTITDADLVLKTNTASWLAYLTNALSGAVTELDLTDNNLVLGTVGQATALSTALDALDASLKTKVVTLKVKAAANITIGATLTSAAGFSALTAIELDKPAANTITISTVDATTELRIADLANVKRDSSSDWLAYIQYLMRNTGTNDFDLDMIASPLAEGEVQAFVTALVTISQNANSSGNRDKIQKVRLKLAPGAWSGNVTDLGINWNGFMSNIDTFTVDATGATVSGTQLYVGFHADLTDQSEYTKTFVSDLNSVDKSNADAWEFYLNYLTKDGPAALDLSGTTLSYVELNALDNGLGTFSTAAGNGDKLSSIHIKVSGAAGGSNYNIAADLDAQTVINTAAEFILDVSGFIHAGTQATVGHAGGTPKAVELRISGVSDLYRDSSTSWGMYLNSVYAGGIPPTSTVDLTSSSSLYFRSQADVDALMTAIQARSDKANIDTLNLRLAPGSVDSDIIFGTGVTVINPTMNITVTGATNNGSMITAADVHYAGSFTSTGKTVTQDFANTVVNPTIQADWTKYLTYVLSSTADGGLGQVSIVPIALTSAPQLTAMMGALNGLSNPLKGSIQHIHLDVSHASFNGGLTLGTGVSGLSNLIQVSYVRASAQADATAAVVGAGDFTSKIQRLRTALNADTLASAATVGSYLRYVLMDAAMGGSELTLVDLTSQALDTTQAGYLNTALGALPDDLSFRITELRLNLNAATAVTFDAAGLRNLATVKYFQTGAGALTWTDAASVGFASATKTRFRALLADVSDKADQAHWSDYITYVMTSVNDGGLGQTTLDLSSITLTSTQVIAFLAALDDYVSKADVTALTLKLDPTFGAGSLNLSGYSNLDGLGADSVTIHRNAAVNAGAPVTVTYGGSFTDANVKIIDPETNTTADKDNTRQQWLEYLTYTINTVGLTSGLLTIAPGDAFTAQSQIYALFDAMEALDSSLKADVVTISIDLSSIASGTVSLKRTDDLALIDFSNLTNVFYKRANLDTNIDTIIATLQTALDTAITVPGTVPAWVFANEGVSDTAIGNAVGDGSIRTAISNVDVAGLKSALVTQLATGVTFPDSTACDADVDTAAAAVSVTVDGDVKNTLATALTPFRSTGKISAIETALTTAFTNGGTTGLGTLPWLKSAWAGYADHDAVMTAVLADGTVSSAISTNGQTIANIKTAVSAKLNSLLIPTSGDLDTLITAIDLTALSGWNSNADDFVSSLRNRLIADLQTLMPWFDTTDTGTNPDVINDFIASTMFNLTVYFGSTFPVAGKWDIGANGAAIKTQITPDLKATFGAVGSPDALSAAGRLTSAIDAAFTAADSGNALTTNTAAWVRPTAGIEADLTTSIQSALTALSWYTGVAATQAAAAVAAGDVANQNAATIISNIKTYLTNNVSRPTANSIFATPVNTAVDSISLAATSTAVTTDFAGVSETLSRYRVAISDVTDKENAGQWTEYLLHKLAPVALGGLGATTLDVSSVDLGNDQVTWFWGGLLDSALDAYRANITSIKFAIDNTGGDRVLDGGGKTFNDNLKIIVVMNNKPNNTFTLGTGGSGFKNSSNADLPDSIVEHRITTARTASATTAEWERWLNHKLSSTFGGEGATTIDVSGTALTRAQLTNFMTALNAVNNSILSNMTLLKIGFTESGSTALTLTGDGSKTYNTNLIVSVTSDNDYSGTISFAGTLSGGSRVLREFVTTAPAVSAASTTWRRYINYRLTTAANGGAEATTMDLSAAHSFTSQAQLNAFFAGLEALTGTGGYANKNVLTALTLKLASGIFGAASARIGYTGSAAVTNLNANINVTIQRNDAQSGSNSYDPIVTINHSDIVTSGMESIVDNVFVGSSVIASSTPEWLGYLNTTLTAAGAGYALELTDVSMELSGVSINNKATALFNAFQALDSTLKAKIDTIKIKLGSGNQSAGALSLSGTLTSAAGFTALSRIIVDVTDAETNTAGTQKIINWAGLTTEAAVKKVMWVNNLASVDFDSGANAIDSWLAYLNYITRTGNASLDTSTINSGNGLTVTQAGYLLDALASFSTANDNANRLTSVLTKLAAAPGAATLSVNQNLSNLSGLTMIQVNVTNSLHTGTQVTVNFGGGTFHANTTAREAYVTQPQPTDATSWGYLLNGIRGANAGNLESIDLSATNIAFVDSLTTEAVIEAFLSALDSSSDKATVKEIRLNLTGVAGLNINIGDTVAGLTGLTYLSIKRHPGFTPVFNATGGVDASDIAVISSDTGTLGDNGTISQWKGYLAYLLENVAHGGSYSGSDPIPLNLTASALRIADATVLGNLETAIADLPVRLKARIGTLLIKTKDDSSNLSGDAFGNAFDSTIADFSELKAVIIDASSTTTGGNKPTFPGVGAFYTTTSITKIVY